MRFSADLLSPGVFVVAESSPEHELDAWRGVIEAESTTADGERGWVVARVDDGRRHMWRILRDNEIHTCDMAGCPRCPHLAPRDARTLVSDLLRREALVGRHRTDADRRNANRIRGLVHRLRKGMFS
jgi:hypothetical protein